MFQGAETTLFAALSTELKADSGLYLEDSAIKEPSRISKDIDDQERLWDLTKSILATWSIVSLENCKDL